ncbi:MAG TPA: hypothetical protein PK622_04750 [Saprospiraceae bacterium]|nr:hypothetical protein [Saprospiraceae bacterium]
MANPRNTRSGCAGVRFAPSRERDQALTIPFAEAVTEIKNCTIFVKKIMETIQKPNFSNVQKELLKLYAREVSEEELLEIRQLLANYFAKKVVVNADKAWDKNEYNEDWVNRMLNKED